jgi:VIT1/CCC1 family predicted Fe2+/Mn2+ transporter
MHTKVETPLGKSLAQALVMFFSYLFSGFLVLAPYMFLSPQPALVLSIVVSVILLFTLGAFGASLSGISIMRNGLTMSIVGGAAIVIGMVAGVTIHYLTGTGFL